MVYILHFDTPLAHAKHYVGYCDESRLTERITEHAQGRGAHIMKVIRERGISFRLARTLPGDRNRERQIKNTHKVSNYCPICKKTKNPPTDEQLP